MRFSRCGYTHQRERRKKNSNPVKKVPLRAFVLVRRPPPSSSSSRWRKISWKKWEKNARFDGRGKSGEMEFVVRRWGRKAKKIFFSKRKKLAVAISFHRFFFLRTSFCRYAHAGRVRESNSGAHFCVVSLMWTLKTNECFSKAVVMWKDLILLIKVFNKIISIWIEVLHKMIKLRLVAATLNQKNATINT